MHVELWGGPLDGKRWHTEKDMPPEIDVPLPHFQENFEGSEDEGAEPSRYMVVRYRLKDLVPSSSALPLYACYHWVSDG
jgi:hypothetical protein